MTKLNSLKEIETKVNDEWMRIEEILKLCTEENEFTTTDRELQLTLVYEELGLLLPAGHLSAKQMLKERIDDLRREAFNYLRMHVNGEGIDPLDKALDLTRRYNEAMSLWLKYVM